MWDKCFRIQNQATESNDTCQVSNTCIKECVKEGTFIRYGWFCALRARTGSKKPFGAGTKRCAVLLALALVCNFYLVRMFIIKHKCFMLISYGVFYFNKVWSCKLFTCVHHEVLPPWPRDSLP